MAKCFFQQSYKHVCIIALSCQNKGLCLTCRYLPVMGNILKNRGPSPDAFILNWIDDDRSGAALLISLHYEKHYKTSDPCGHAAAANPLG